MIHQSKANSGRFQETKKVIQYLIPYAPELPSSNPLLYFPAAEWRGRGLPLEMVASVFCLRIAEGEVQPVWGERTKSLRLIVVEDGPTGNRQ